MITFIALLFWYKVWNKNFEFHDIWSPVMSLVWYYILLRLRENATATILCFICVDTLPYCDHYRSLSPAPAPVAPCLTMSISLSLMSALGRNLPDLHTVWTQTDISNCLKWNGVKKNKSIGKQNKTYLEWALSTTLLDKHLNRDCKACICTAWWA